MRENPEWMVGGTSPLMLLLYDAMVTTGPPERFRYYPVGDFGLWRELGVLFLLCLCWGVAVFAGE